MPSILYMLEQLQLESVTKSHEPSSKPITRSTSNQTLLYVAHLNDTHIDCYYTPGTSYVYSKPMCCRPYTPADAPNATRCPCGAWGHPRCDPPMRFLSDRDVVPHDFWLTNLTSVEIDCNTTYAALQTLNGEGPVYLAIGNHDTSPVNIFPVSSRQPSNFTPQWAYGLFAVWSNRLALQPSPSTSPQLQRQGNYSILHRQPYTSPPTPDPLSQFEWLTTELFDAETHHQRVWLLTHIPPPSPPGNSYLLPCYNRVLNQIIVRFRTTIAAIFAGHRHTDLFQVYYNRQRPNFSASNNNNSNNRFS
ncbi:uncharacterized protein BO97DRAFT_440260 [Aspergillus homomorphus CBS 101889]|uniref:Calcineurin-like phosphoesterase domain-containing protein n=1 Tax=Aspergillus homomorphus (strain CBS 101889) TaxID=1450537 RepID=A0A395I959_ASPHC|nr:hypothetical protein BO97DRAFT_440260 [Aspergillus homomorphus CBS 101889]RAL16495.1 hypothetical protein BO97DRAFT_440260 [Aspergillus homomorphus CBS 101889]